MLVMMNNENNNVNNMRANNSLVHFLPFLRILLADSPTELPASKVFDKQQVQNVETTPSVIITLLTQIATQETTTAENNLEKEGIIESNNGTTKPPMHTSTASAIQRYDKADLCDANFFSLGSE